MAGYKDGIGANAMFNNPTLVTIDQRTGTLFVGEAKTDAVRKITPQGMRDEEKRKKERKEKQS